MDLPTPAGPMTSWQHRGIVGCVGRDAEQETRKIRRDERLVIVDEKAYYEHEHEQACNAVVCRQQHQARYVLLIRRKGVKAGVSRSR